MRVNRETLVRIAKETALKRANSDPGLVAAYLTGSLRTENPFLGNSTDIDMVLVHGGEVTIRREILALTPEVHLDIVHNLRSEYEKPKELRVNPWLGPDLYDSLPLYNTQHFFEFIQAGVRAGYDEPVNVMARARRNADHARQIWSGLGLTQESGPARLLSYLKSVNHAANAIAVLTGSPLGERRFQLQFRERAEAAGVPGLAVGLAGLLGSARQDAAALKEFIPDWERAFVEASGRENVSPGIALPRLGYYKLSFEAMLAGDSSQSILWPLMHTWTLSAAVLSPAHQARWKAACETLGLAGKEFNERMEGLDRFLDTVEETLETMAARQGI